jgi:hypothetical protein
MIIPEIKSFIKKENKPLLDYQGDENYLTAYSDFYEQILNGTTDAETK